MRRRLHFAVHTPDATVVVHGTVFSVLGRSASTSALTGEVGAPQRGRGLHARSGCQIYPPSIRADDWQTPAITRSLKHALGGTQSIVRVHGSVRTAWHRRVVAALRRAGYASRPSRDETQGERWLRGARPRDDELRLLHALGAADASPGESLGRQTSSDGGRRRARRRGHLRWPPAPGARRQALGRRGCASAPGSPARILRTTLATRRTGARASAHLRSCGLDRTRRVPHTDWRRIWRACATRCPCASCEELLQFALRTRRARKGALSDEQEADFGGTGVGACRGGRCVLEQRQRRWNPCHLCLRGEGSHRPDRLQ